MVRLPAYMAPTLKEALAHMGPTTRVMGPIARVMGPIARVMGPVTRVMGPIARVTGPITKVTDPTTSKGHMELDTAHQGVALQLPEPQIMATPEVAIHPLEMGMPLPSPLMEDQTEGEEATMPPTVAVMEKTVLASPLPCF